MNALIWAIGATIIVSLISLIGVVFLFLKKNVLDNILLLLVGFSAGALMGGAFLHLIPEAAEKLTIETISLLTIIGFSLFFIIERILHWHHCHKYGKCEVHTFTYMNLIGDGVHNFIDGAIIAAGFVISKNLGIATTLAVIAHEIPQEISDFGVLIYGGFTKLKALLFNFISALTSVLGAIFGYFIFRYAEIFTTYLLPIAAGGFIYIFASDLIPELHRETNLSKSIMSFIFFIIGLLTMVSLKLLFK